MVIPGFRRDSGATSFTCSKQYLTLTADGRPVRMSFLGRPAQCNLL